jgi:hypothetical protein
MADTSTAKNCRWLRGFVSSSTSSKQIRASPAHLHTRHAHHQICQAFVLPQFAWTSVARLQRQSSHVTVNDCICHLKNRHLAASEMPPVRWICHRTQPACKVIDGLKQWLFSRFGTCKRTKLHITDIAHKSHEKSATDSNDTFKRNTSLMLMAKLLLEKGRTKIGHSVEK